MPLKTCPAAEEVVLPQHIQIPGLLVYLFIFFSPLNKDILPTWMWLLIITKVFLI